MKIHFEQYLGMVVGICWDMLGYDTPSGFLMFFVMFKFRWDISPQLQHVESTGVGRAL